MKIAKIALALALLAGMLLNITACSKFSQKDYDNLKNELTTTQAQLNTAKTDLAAAQSKLAAGQSAQTQFQDLSAKYDQLKKDYDGKVNELAASDSRYQALNVQYTQVKKQYDAMIAGTVVLNPDDIEQATFELINKERLAAGVPALQWGTHLYDWCKKNDNAMIQSGKQEDPAYTAWHEVYWSAGCSSIDGAARGIVAAWKANQYLFEKNVLAKTSIYGGVGVVKSGDVFFVTFIADIFK